MDTTNDDKPSAKTLTSRSDPSRRKSGKATAVRAKTSAYVYAGLIAVTALLVVILASKFAESREGTVTVSMKRRIKRSLMTCADNIKRSKESLTEQDHKSAFYHANAADHSIRTLRDVVGLSITELSGMDIDAMESAIEEIYSHLPVTRSGTASSSAQIKKNKDKPS